MNSHCALDNLQTWPLFDIFYRKVMLDTPATDSARNVIQMDAYMINVEHLNTIICKVCDGRGHVDEKCPTKSRLQKLTEGAPEAKNLLESALLSRKGATILAGGHPPLGSMVRYGDNE